jgi:hypothetical protein
MKKYSLFLLLMLAIFLSSCEDVVNPEINSSKPTLIVDAMLTNENLPQTIRLTQTIGFLDNSQAQPAVLGAKIQITNSKNQTFLFIDEKKDGNYTWKPSNNETLGEVGTAFTLNVEVNNEKFIANTIVKRTAIYDSLAVKFETEGKVGTGSKEGYYAQILSKNAAGKVILDTTFAKDQTGVGDCYRIKTYRNDTLFASPNEMVLAYDASFSKGGSTDGTSFIFPIRTAINKRSNPYKIGDKIQVDILSLTEETFDYLTRVRTQQQNGGLFANPPANVGTNIKNTNTASTIQALGWFSVSARISKTTVVKK